ncbi:T6SS effector amidase Tae4 family protein [Viridibacterium curvum]|uniref:Uncharacterized protein n=1 Tax=Viridibacterium curvum TaxID=1101404 RepID=A0ABP9R7N5_9RHOO
MKPSYAALKAANFLSDTAATDLALSASNPGSINKSALRMSLTLLECGLPFMGRLPVKTGRHQGKFVEPGTTRLAEQLSMRSILGKPEIFTDAEIAKYDLSYKRGVVFFEPITGYDGGHIDLLEPANATLLCSVYGYFNCKAIWFWELA